MSPLLVSVLSFLAFIVSSLAGLCLAHSLPETQLTDRNRDQIKEYLKNPAKMPDPKESLEQKLKD